MLFSSVGFLFRFLPIFMIIYLLVPAKYRNVILLLGSLIFYGVGEPYFVLLLIFSVLINYGFGRLMFWEPKRPMKDRKKSRIRRRKLSLILALILDFGTLFVFKYWDFAAENVNMLIGKDIMPMLALALPLGISFYTFQMVSYQIDCYRETVKEPAGLIEFAAYVSMFPQLIAGPIVRYEEIAERMHARRITAGKLENGLKLFTIGLGFKVLLANQIGTLWNTIMTAGPGNLSIPVAWMGAFAYSFQIYFDFWGYSLMAIGLGKLLGFRIPKNFDDPYASRSVSEFWRRWHITLGRWFKEYVYIPLGGNRKGRLRTVCNLFIVWSLTGLWHGASWNFVLWGILFFVLLSIEKGEIGKKLEKTSVLGHIYVLLVIPVTWVVFAITDIRQLGAYLGNLVGIHAFKTLAGTQYFLRCLKEYWWLFLFCILFATPYPMKQYNKWKDKWFITVILLLVFWLSVHELVIGSNNPFLYFRF